MRVAPSVRSISCNFSCSSKNFLRFCPPLSEGGLRGVPEWTAENPLQLPLGKGESLYALRDPVVRRLGARRHGRRDALAIGEGAAGADGVEERLDAVLQLVGEGGDGLAGPGRGGE